jgi:transporter family-2 protein
MEAFAIPFLLVVGGLLAVQAAANVQLAGAVGSPFGGSTLQLAIGAAVLALAAAAGGSLGALDGIGNADGWELLGGLGSALYITSGILLFPRLGAVVTVALWIAGQMVGSLALDWTGWLGVAPRDPSPADLVGVALVVVGAGMVARVQRGPDAQSLVRSRAAWLSLAIVAGAALPVQGAVNAELRTELDAILAVATISFVVATASMALVLALALATRATARPRASGLRTLPWWGWLGGMIGATYVTAVFSMIPEIGTAPTIALTVGGQQLASVAVDRFGLLGLQRRSISGQRLAAVGGLLAGVALIQLT